MTRSVNFSRFCERETENCCHSCGWLYWILCGKANFWEEIFSLNQTWWQNLVIQSKNILKNTLIHRSFWSSRMPTCSYSASVSHSVFRILHQHMWLHIYRHTVEGLCTQQLCKTKLVKLPLEVELVKSMLSLEPVWDNRKRKKPLPFEPWHAFMETAMDWAVAFDDFSADVTLAAGTVIASEYRPL